MSPLIDPRDPEFSQIQTRRAFLRGMGHGFGGLALSAMLHRDGFASPGWTPPDGQPHFAPKAKSVIWLFMIGGASHVESFDYKPAIDKYAGKTIAETPCKEILSSPYLANERIIAGVNGKFPDIVYPLQTGFQQHGESGLYVSNWWPHVSQCVDDISFVRSMWTEDSNHGAQLQFHTGRNRIDGFFPTIGAWATYGLGSLNENLPQFVVMGNPIGDCCGGLEAHRANYLGAQYSGVPLQVDPKNPLPYGRPGEGVLPEEQRAQFELIDELNRLSLERYSDDKALNARIKSYELAYRMQTAVPAVMRLEDETQATRELYGLDQVETKTFGEQMLAARRMVERGVRFIQVYHGGSGGAGGWDAHKNLPVTHPKVCKQVDQSIAALLKDLKARGLLDETLVVWVTEFGRTPGSLPGTNGRDHHPYGFTVWLAGGGVKGGIAHGATDELGFHAVEHRHYVTDIHATILHQLGLDPRRLVVPGRKRLARDFGEPIREILA